MRKFVIALALSAAFATPAMAEPFSGAYVGAEVGLDNYEGQAEDLFTAGDLLSSPVAWLFGNEAWGLPAELAAAADARVSIPIHGRAESLNLSTAAAVCLYASAGARGTVET